MNSNQANVGKAAAGGVALGVAATAIGAFMTNKLGDRDKMGTESSNETSGVEHIAENANKATLDDGFEGEISWLSQNTIFISNNEELLQFVEAADSHGLPLEEINKIDALIKHNLDNGVSVMFTSEYGTGFLGTYDPSVNLITIMPETVDMGYEDLLKVITHETVHAEQDIADGLDNDTYATIGSEINSYGIQNVENYYSGLSSEEQILELEANSSEVDIDDTLDHIGVEC